MRHGFAIGPRGEAVLAALGYASFADAFADRRGRPLRMTPHRCTVAQRAAGLVLYRKLRSRRPQDARNEWRRLVELGAAGFAVPEPLFLAVVGARSVIGFGAVAGHAARDLLAAAPDDHDPTEFLLRRILPVVARLHGGGWIHRDLYTTHLFASDLEPAGPPVALIDVERVFRPRWRRRRWVIKDLAGLVASWPGGLPVRAGMRALAALGHDRDIVAPVLAKAARIRRHRPRHVGDRPPAWWLDAGAAEGSVRSP